MHNRFMPKLFPDFVNFEENLGYVGMSSLIYAMVLFKSDQTVTKK